MLSAIKGALIEAAERCDRDMDKGELRWSKIQNFPKAHNYIMNADVRELCGVLAATSANQIPARLVEAGKLKKVYIRGHCKYGAIE